MLESAVSGFHVFKHTWTPVVGEERIADRELGNAKDNTG